MEAGEEMPLPGAQERGLLGEVGREPGARAWRPGRSKSQAFEERCGSRGRLKQV